MPMVNPSTELGARRRPWRVVIVVVGLLVAVNLLIVAGLATEQGDEREPLPAAVESVQPIQDGIASSSDGIVVDLRDDTTGVIILDGTEIPEDQLQRTEDLGIVEFRPGEGREITRFEPGYHQVTVRYWPRTGTRESDAESFTWRFRAAG